MTAWLHVIGVGEAGISALPPAMRTIIGFAETVLGPPRFLAQLEHELEQRAEAAPESAESVTQRSLDAVARALLDDDTAPASERSADAPALVPWEGKLEGMLAQIERLRDTPTVILATGDPMWFGIGATLARRLAADEFEVHPHVSSFQLAAAELRWPLQHLALLSLHGRPPELIQPHILPGARILALTADADTVAHVADILTARGYGDSPLTVLESLGGPEQRVTTRIAARFDPGEIGDFHVLAIDCVADRDALVLPPVIGLPDDAFVSDGQLTKREVRAITLAKLLPLPRALLWDVGAGSGSIAIEWMRAAREAEAIAFERDDERLEMIATNAAALGAPTLRVVAGEAPDSFASQPAPDAVFIGGSVGHEALFAACWHALKPGGRLVANAVTLDGERALYERHSRHGGDLVRLEVAAVDFLGGQRIMRPRLAVTQWSVTKPAQYLVAAP